MEAAVMGPGVWRLCQWRVPWTSPRLVMRSVSCCPAPATPAPTIRYESTMTIFIIMWCPVSGVRIINIYIMLLCWCPSPSLHCYSMIISHHLVHCVVVQQSPSLLPAGHWPNIANKIGEKFWHFTNTCWLGKVGPPELRLLCAQVETWS